MKDDLTLCAEVFLREQTKLYDEQVFDNIKEVREYLSEEGMDVDEITDEELAEELEVFALPDGRFFVVEG